MKDRLRCEIATPQTLDISGFISTYKEAFGGPPYFEEYTDCEIYEGVIAHGCNQYFMRTASVGSNSMPMYMKSGAIPVSQQQDVSSTEQATENHTQSLQRIYLWGDCMASARKIEEIRHQQNYPLLDSQ